jgi:hypothetical protein
MKLLRRTAYASCRGRAPGGQRGQLHRGRLLHLCGLLTLALNTAEPLLTGRYGCACLDTVAPLFLLGWGHVGPAFLAQLHTPTHPNPRLEVNTAVPAPEPVRTGAPVPEPVPRLPPPLLPRSLP